MANINDYLIWRGDLKINKDTPFNEVDSMILARFSYLRFDKIKMDDTETIESISSKMKSLDNDEFLYNGDKELITNLGESTRFKNMQITDYVKKADKEVEKQFGAVTIHISDKEMYISFIGTDSTITGWKEDFNMAFMDNVPCQLEGKEYVEKIANKYPDKKIRIGGHSKGGNVAIYSAVTVSNAVQKRIIKGYNYDGPGFNKKMIEKYKNSEILNKLETYMPQDSIIGRILEHEEKCEISLSIEKGIYQHDIFSWQVLRDDLIKSEKLTDNSEAMGKTLKEWLATTKPEQRKIFFDGIFEVLYSTEANTFSEIQKSLSKNIVKIFKSYGEISDEDKKTITEMIKLFAKTYMSEIMEQNTNKLEAMKEYYKEESLKKFEEIEKKYFRKNKNV
ncbi:MAG: DUF2974 domain-containing protein [Clostridia bacterium]|nr:DUF2974 domain-containing protein [Clostridia bacterium]